MLKIPILSLNFSKWGLRFKNLHFCKRKYFDKKRIFRQFSDNQRFRVGNCPLCLLPLPCQDTTATGCRYVVAAVYLRASQDLSVQPPPQQNQAALHRLTAVARKPTLVSHAALRIQLVTDQESATA